MRLLEQEQLCVARDARGEGLADTEGAVGQGDVERKNSHCICSADAGAECSEGRAQHVHPGITLSHHRGGGDCVLRRSTKIGSSADLGDACPYETCGAELRDGLELIVGCRVAESQLRQRSTDGQAALGGECTEVLEAGGDCGSEFFGVAGTAL